MIGVNVEEVAAKSTELVLAENARLQNEGSIFDQLLDAFVVAF